MYFNFWKQQIDCEKLISSRCHGPCFLTSKYGDAMCNKYLFAIHFSMCILYFAEGFLSTCSFDYFDVSFDNKLFVMILFTFAYVIPIALIIFYYSQICRHVFSHEKTLRNQAKKMNVGSLRMNQEANGRMTAEIRIAKATIVCCFLFVLGKLFLFENVFQKISMKIVVFSFSIAWTPYR